MQATTREAIAYAKDAGLPMVVAANKYDREGREAAVKKLSAQLVQAGVLLEEMGGDVPLVPCSATWFSLGRTDRHFAPSCARTRTTTWIGDSVSGADIV